METRNYGGREVESDAGMGEWMTEAGWEVGTGRLDDRLGREERR